MFDLDNLVADFQNEFKVCTRCKGTNLNTLIPRLEKLDPNANILKLRCVSYCGPGRDYPFVFLNNKPIKGEDEDDLTRKIKKVLDKQLFL